MFDRFFYKNNSIILVISTLCLAALSCFSADFTISDGTIKAAFYDSASNYNLHYIAMESNGKIIADWASDPDYGKLFNIEMYMRDLPADEPYTLDNNSNCSSMESDYSVVGNKKTLKLKWLGFDVRPQTSGQSNWKAIEPDRFVLEDIGGGHGQALHLAQSYGSASNLWHPFETEGDDIVTTSFSVITPAAAAMNGNLLTFYGCEGEHNSAYHGYRPFSYSVVLRYNAAVSRWSVRNYNPSLENITGDVIEPGSVVDITVTADLSDRTYSIDISSGSSNWSNTLPAYWTSGADGTAQTGICFSFNSYAPDDLFVDDVVVQSKFDSAGFESPEYQPGQVAMSYLEDPNGAGAVDVEATMVAYTDREGIEWDIDVVSRCSRYGVSTVQFPCIRFVPIDGSGANDTIAYPHENGRIIPNPFSAVNRQNYAFSNINFKYPDNLINMQWFAFYDSVYGGLYYATEDPNGYEKTFCHHNRDDGVWFRLQHEPEDKNVAGVDYHSPFSFVTKYTPGHWYDAAQIYRQWALQQPWTSKGPLYQRSDVSPDVADSAIEYIAYTKEPFTVQQAVENAEAFNQFFDPPCAVPMVWTNWSKWKPEDSGYDEEQVASNSGTYFPVKDGFCLAVQAVEANDIFVLPYVEGRAFDIAGGRFNVPPEWLPYTVKDKDGISALWTETVPNLVDMCRTTEFFRNYVSNTCSDLALNHHCKGVYLDQTDGVQSQCFDASHGHPVGGGDYQAKALHQLFQQTRDACRAVDEDFVTMGENTADLFMDVADISLRHEDVHPGYVPLYAAVYGGYQMTVGARTNSMTVIEELKDTYNTRLRFALSNMLVYGSKIGRIAIQQSIHLTDPNFTENMQLLKKAADYRYAARKYLQYGRMLRPIEFNNAIPDVSWFWDSDRWGGKDVYIYQPAIMSSVWEAPDGTAAVVMQNISDSSQFYDFTLYSADCPVLGSEINIYKFADQYGTKHYYDTNNSSSYTFTGSLAADEIRIFTLESVCEDMVGNFNDDCTVNSEDLAVLVDSWLSRGIPGQMPEDLIEDGEINLFDFTRFCLFWLDVRP